MGFLGVLHGFIGINISHDALHGSFSADPETNRLLGYTYDFVGLSSCIWKQTHNIGHHTYTNIAGHDPDIDKPDLLRLSPHDPWHWFHRFQKYYIWFLYALVGINWVLYSDYVLFFKYRSEISKREQILFFLFKALYTLIFMIIPFFVMEALGGK